MKIIQTAILLFAIPVVLAGCSSHHQDGVNTQASKNEAKAMFGGGPITSKAPPLSAYSLSGYGTKH